MKALLVLVTAVFLFVGNSANAQRPVRSSDLRGTWRLVFDVDEEADTAMGRVVLNAVDGFLDELDIRFEFRRNGELKVETNAFGDTEEEYSEWRINSEGQLILGETEHVHSDDTVWMRDGRRLVAYEYDEEGRLNRKESVYLERVRD